VLATQPSGREHHRYDDIMPLPDMVGDLDGLALYAGQSAGLVHDEGPAGDIVRRIAAEAREVVEGLA
jgi:NAD(P)H-dependent flavin oxidoreductase YrpB (nitropropane dioxygenase family)